MADDERRASERATMDQITISVHRDMCSLITTRYKYEIIVYHPHGAEHFGFVRFFATITDRDHVMKSRSEIARILREQKRAAWERYHRYVE